MKKNTSGYKICYILSNGKEVIMYNGNENITICDHPLIKHKITMLRMKTTGTNEFRALVEEIAVLI